MPESEALGCPSVSETNCRKVLVGMELWSDIRFRLEKQRF